MLAESYVVNQSWDANGVSYNLADSIGLMVYTGTTSLDYVKNYVNGADQWTGKYGAYWYLESDEQLNSQTCCFECAGCVANNIVVDSEKFGPDSRYKIINMNINMNKK